MPAENPVLGRRIVIWGVTGSGKSTLARQVGAAFDLPVVQLDAIRHHDGWDSTDWPEFRAQLSETLDRHGDGWVLEGSYAQIMDVYLSRADTLIWLHLPFYVSFSRLFKRTVTRAWDKKPLYHEGGPRESWRLSFFDRRSILWYSISNHRRAVRERKKRVAALPPTIRAYELRSAKEVAVLLRVAQETARSIPAN